jgi:hypothetical protein
MVKFSDLSRKSISSRGGVETKRFLVGIETKIKSDDQKILDFRRSLGSFVPEDS